MSKSVPNLRGPCAHCGVEAHLFSSRSGQVVFFWCDRAFFAGLRVPGKSQDEAVDAIKADDRRAKREARKARSKPKAYEIRKARAAAAAAKRAQAPPPVAPKRDRVRLDLPEPPKRARVLLEEPPRRERVRL